MSDADQLAAIGQKLTAALTSAYTSTDPNAALVFVPGGVTVPNDLVQAGVVNPTQMQTFLETNFDSPFLISPAECAVHGRDASYGTSSQIYMIAATSAEPLGSPTDASWKRVAAEITMAQHGLDATNMAGGFVCEPDDWFLPANASYWTIFDSSQTQQAPAATTTATPPKPMLNPHLWVLHSLPVAATVMHATPAVAPKPAPTLPAAQAHTVTPMKLNIAAKVMHPVILPTPSPAKPTPPAPPPSSTITVQLQHQCVALGYMSGGVSWWDGAFLADTGWFIPGMTRGALLPPPTTTAQSPDLAYGIPVALIVVQGLKITGNWTGETAASLGAVGPFSLQGAVPTPGNNGMVTFSRPGMQVIALLCSKLPILPPVDAPAPTLTVGTPQPTTTPPADNAPPATTNTTTPSAGSANTPTPAASPSSTPAATPSATPTAAPSPTPAAAPSAAAAAPAADPPAGS